MKRKKLFKNTLLSVLAIVIAFSFTTFAFAKPSNNQLELAAQGETKAEAKKYASSFTEGVSDTVASAPKESIAAAIPKVQANADKNVETSVLKERIPFYSQSDISNMDMRKASGITVDDLKKANTYSGLYGLEKYFVQAEKDYGVNCLFLYAIAVTESGGGIHMFLPNNMFGYGQKSFSSKAQCIDYVAERISEDYLNKNGPYFSGPTPKDVHKIYCTTSGWSKQVITVMTEMYSKIRANNLAKYN